MVEESDTGRGFTSEISGQDLLDSLDGSLFLSPPCLRENHVESTLFRNATSIRPDFPFIILNP